MRDSLPIQVSDAATQAKERGMTLPQWVNLCMTAWERAKEKTEPDDNRRGIHQVP